MPARAEITREWIAEILGRAEYQVQLPEQDSDTVLARHYMRPNITVRLNRTLGLITVTHYWRMKKPGWAQQLAVLRAINEANRRSWFSTFYRDADGDLGVSSYIFLTEHISAEDLLGFVEKEAAKFREVVLLSELAKWLV